jgi:hypothetical protein
MNASSGYYRLNFTLIRFQPYIPGNENETKFLAFPGLANSMLIFGAGHGFEALAIYVACP